MFPVANAEPIPPAQAGRLLGPGTDPNPIGIALQQQPTPSPARKPNGPPIVVTAFAGWSSLTRQFQVIDPGVRDGKQQVVLTTVSATFRYRLFTVTRGGRDHIVAAVLRTEDDADFSRCHIFHHPLAQQYGQGINDADYGTGSSPWVGLISKYVRNIGAQHAIASRVPLIIPLIRIEAWSAATADNYVFGNDATATLGRLMEAIAGTTTLPQISGIRTSSFSNGVQSNTQTVARFPPGFVERATDYDSSIAAKGTRQLDPALCEVVRYSQSPGLLPATTEFKLPYSAWPASGWLKGEKPAQTGDQAWMEWVHAAISHTCHAHAVR